MSGNEIFEAIKERNLERVRELVQKDEKVLLERKSDGQYSCMVIGWAASQGYWDVAEVIAKTTKSRANSLVDLCAGDSYEYGVVLLRAVRKNKGALVRLLLEQGALIGYIDKRHHRNSVFHDAIKANVDLVKLLMQYDNGLAIINYRNADGYSPLELACKKGAWHIAEVFLGCDKLKIDNQNEHTQMALMEAVKAGEENMVELFVKRGAKLDIYSKENGYSPLYWAIKLNNPKMVRLLLKLDAPRMMNSSNQTPLEFALELDRLECVEARIEFSMNNNESFTSKEGGTRYLFGAIKLNRPDLVAWSLKKGADPNYKYKDGKTACEFANELKQFKCLIALKYPSIHLSKEDYAKTDAEVFYRVLVSNVLRAEEIPEFLKILQVINTYMLIRARNSLQDSAGALDQPCHDFVVRIINAFLKYPDYFPSSGEIDIISRLQEISPEAKSLLTCIHHQNAFQDFCSRIRTWLIQKKIWLDQEQANGSWKRQNWLGMWVQGRPRHVNNIQEKLVHLNASTPSDNVLNIYIYIIKQLLEIRESEHHDMEEKRRDKNTIEFYETMWDEMKTFSYIPLPYYQKTAISIPSFPEPSAPLLHTINLASLFTSVPDDPPPAYETVVTNRRLASVMPAQDGLYPRLGETEICNPPAPGYLYPWLNTTTSSQQQTVNQATGIDVASTVVQQPAQLSSRVEFEFVRPTATQQVFDDLMKNAPDIKNFRLFDKPINDGTVSDRISNKTIEPKLEPKKSMTAL